MDEGSTGELGAIVDRLEAAAARLRDDTGAPVLPLPTPVPERRRLAEIVDGLERANVEVRRARTRLAQLEARLDGRRAA
jgi:hypothetical protein